MIDCLSKSNVAYSSGVQHVAPSTVKFQHIATQIKTFVREPVFFRSVDWISGRTRSHRGQSVNGIYLQIV